MLRNTPSSVKPSSSRRRGAVIAVTLMTALFVAGIRRPVGEFAYAAEPVTSAAVVAQSADLNLENVPADTVLLAAFRPAELAAREELQPIVKFIETSMDVEKTGISLKDVDQFLVIGVPRLGADPGEMGPPVTEVRTTSTTDFEPFILHHVGETTEQTIDGTTLRAKDDISQSLQVAAAWVVDDRTIIQGSAENILRLARSRRTGGRAPEWATRIQAMENVQVGVGFDVTFLRPIVQAEFQRSPNPMLGMFSPLWQNTDVALAVAQVGKEMDLTVHGWSADEAGATKIKQTVNMLLPVANGMLQGSKASAQDVPPDMRETLMKGIDLAENALNTAEVAQDGSHVTLSLSGDGLSIATMAGLLLPAIQQAREAARRTQSQNNLKQIMLAFHNYNDVHNQFPPAVLLGPDGKTQYSWRVAILPYIDQQELYEQYNTDESWDSPNNRKLLTQIPGTLRHPNDEAGSTNASYFAFVGKETAIGNTPGEGNPMLSITDGTSNTLMVVETKRDIPWTKPEDIPYSDEQPLPKLGGWHDGGYNAGFADGWVRFLADSIDETLLRNLINRADGNPVNF